MSQTLLRVGTAGWSIPRDHATAFDEGGSHLQRYAARLPAVEINSSFYRPHRAATYARWAESVPEGFRFAVKMPKSITHEHKLCDIESLLDAFLSEATTVGDRLGPILVQLPPSAVFEGAVAAPFFALLRDRFAGQVACEPRHESWFTPEADAMLVNFQIARAAADPARVSLAAVPGGWDGLVYYRLHGSPRMYDPSYSTEFLTDLAGRLAQAISRGVPTWCIFDNTGSGAATANALEMLQIIATDSAG